MARTVEQALGIAKFTGKCGPDSSATSQQGLKANEQVELNGSTDLSECIVGNAGARVYSIVMTGKGSPGNEEGNYSYVIAVGGQGPKGSGAGGLTLSFTDEAGAIYLMTLGGPTRRMYYLRFNSGQPAIKKIAWSNSAFEVES
jgi:hypothetical protein